MSPYTATLAYRMPGPEQARELFRHIALRDRMRERGFLELGGYFVLNNALFATFLATMVNYVFVLVALRVDFA